MRHNNLKVHAKMLQKYSLKKKHRIGRTEEILWSEMYKSVQLALIFEWPLAVDPRPQLKSFNFERILKE